MKRIALLFVVLASFALAGCNQQPAVTGPKIAVVDQAKVLQQCEPGKQLMSFLDMRGKELQAEFAEMQAEAQANQTPEGQAKFQEQVQKLQGRAQAEQQKAVMVIHDAFQEVVDAYVATKELDVILPSEQVVAFGPAADVTDDIIAEMNKKELSFHALDPEKKPEAADEAQEAPAAEEGEAAKSE